MTAFLSAVVVLAVVAVGVALVLFLDELLGDN